MYFISQAVFKLSSFYRKKKIMRKRVFLGLGLFFISASIIMLEVDLTRIFSVTMWYHFSFFIISLAMMGLASSSMIVFYYKDRINNLLLYLFYASLLFGISITFSFIMSENVTLPQFFINDRFNIFTILSLIYKSMLLFLPFFFAGACLALLFSFLPDDFSYLYFWDLSGAAAGASLIVSLLNNFSAPSILIFLSCVAFMSTLFFMASAERLRVKYIFLPVMLIVISCSAFYLNIKYNYLDVHKVKAYGSFIQEVEAQTIFKKWSAVSRIAVFPEWVSANGNTRYCPVSNDGGAPTLFVNHKGKLENSHFRKTFRALPFNLKKKPNILIIGSAGGIDILSALASRANHVTGVEINPVIVDLLKGKFASFTHNLFYDKRVRIVNSEARHFIASVPDKFDIISMTMIDTWAANSAGAYTFQENNLYTLEAFKSYLEHLNDNGIFSVTRYLLKNELLRTVTTGLTCLEQKGVEDPLKNIIVVTDELGKRGTVLLKNVPFSSDEINSLENFVNKNGYYIIYAPSINECNVSQSFYECHIKQLIKAIRNYIKAFNRGKDGAHGFRRKFHLNIEPTTDNNPFFFFMIKKGHLFNPLNKIDHNGFGIALLFGTIFALFILCLVIIFLPLYFCGKDKIHNVSMEEKLIIGYFCCIGSGYMFIEVPIIQKLSLMFSSPAHSLTVTLFLLLFSSGIGSLFFYKTKLKNVKYFKGLVFLCIIISQLAFIIFAGRIIEKTLGQSFLIRFLAIALLIVPMGFFMGIPMPMGISTLYSKLKTRLIPWAWGANGAASVISASFSILVAIYYGFSKDIYLAIISYGLAFLFLSLSNLAKASRF